MPDVTDRVVPPEPELIWEADSPVHLGGVGLESSPRRMSGSSGGVRDHRLDGLSPRLSRGRWCRCRAPRPLPSDQSATRLRPCAPQCVDDSEPGGELVHVIEVGACVCLGAVLVSEDNEPIVCHGLLLAGSGPCSAHWNRTVL